MPRFGTQVIDHGWNKLLKEYKFLNKADVFVGITNETDKRSDGKSNAAIGLIHEMGKGRVPVRKWHAPAMEGQGKNILHKRIESLHGSIARGHISGIKALNIIGKTAENLMKKSLVDVKSPPLKPATLAAKRKAGNPGVPGWPSPLIGKLGELYRSITYKIRREGI